MRGKTRIRFVFFLKGAQKSGHPVLLDEVERLGDFDKKNQLFYSGGTVAGYRFEVVCLETPPIKM